MRQDERRSEIIVHDKKVEWGMIIGNLIAAATLGAIIWVHNSIEDMKDNYKELTGVTKLLSYHQTQQDKELDDHELRIRAILELDQGRNEIVRKLDAKRNK